jgi:non-ribosomal peptide synthetase component F
VDQVVLVVLVAVVAVEAVVEHGQVVEAEVVAALALVLVLVPVALAVVVQEILGLLTVAVVAVLAVSKDRRLDKALAHKVVRLAVVAVD